MILKTLVANNYLTLPTNSRSFDPSIKPNWWKEDHFCNYHRSKGHNTNDCFKLKDSIQDLIDGGIVLTIGLVKNLDHKAFKTPLPKYDKGESSQANKKNHDAKIHYTYATNDNVINMIEPVERVFMMRPQKEEEAKLDVPKLVL